MLLAIVVALVAAGIVTAIFFTSGTIMPLSNNNHGSNTETERTNEQPINISNNASLQAASTLSPPDFPYPPFRTNETGMFVYQNPENIGILADICGNFKTDPINVPGNPEHPAILKRGEGEIAIPFCYWSKNIMEATWTLKASGWPSPYPDKGVHVRFDKDSFHTPAFPRVLKEYLAAKPAGGNFAVFVKAGDTAELGQHIFFVYASVKHDDPARTVSEVGWAVYVDVRGK